MAPFSVEEARSATGPASVPLRIVMASRRPVPLVDGCSQMFHRCRAAPTSGRSGATRCAHGAPCSVSARAGDAPWSCPCRKPAALTNHRQQEASNDRHAARYGSSVRRQRLWECACSERIARCGFVIVYTSSNLFICVRRSRDPDGTNGDEQGDPARTCYGEGQPFPSVRAHGSAHGEDAADVYDDRDFASSVRPWTQERGEG